MYVYVHICRYVYFIYIHMFYIWFSICIVYLVHVYRLLHSFEGGREDKKRSSVVILVKNNVNLAKIIIITIITSCIRQQKVGNVMNVSNIKKKLENKPPSVTLP